MADQFHLSKIEIRSLANELSKQQGECQALVTKIYNNVNALKGVWQDDSQVAYIASIEDFKSSLNRLIKAIGDYSFVLGRAVNTHESTEMSNAAEARGLKIDDIKI